MRAIIHLSALARKHCDVRAALAEEMAMCENSRSEEIKCHLHNQSLGNRRLNAFSRCSTVISNPQR
jgi:hypothetical protein